MACSAMYTSDRPTRSLTLLGAILPLVFGCSQNLFDQEQVSMSKKILGQQNSVQHLLGAYLLRVKKGPR
jgi:hypothetical protein